MMQSVYMVPLNKDKFLKQKKYILSTASKDEQEVFKKEIWKYKKFSRDLIWGRPLEY